MSLVFSVEMSRATSDCRVSASMFGFAIVLFLTSGLAFSTANHFTHIGCYIRNDVAAYNYGSVIDPFSWEVCVNLCVMKMTVFAGMSSYSRECFCGNQIPKLSSSTEDSRCNRCQKDRRKYCGAPSTVSLYQLTVSNSFPTALLIATEDGVNISVLGNTDGSQTLIPFEDGASFVDYHYGNQEIYLSCKTKIFKSVYVSHKSKFGDPTLFVAMDHIITGLIIDWVRNFMFFSCNEKVYKVVLSSRTYYFNTLGSSNFHLVPTPRVITWDTIVYMSKGMYRGIDDFIYYRLNGVQPSALDLHQEKHYYIEDTYINVRHLSDIFSEYYYISYVLYNGSEVFNSCRLDVADRSVVWVIKDTDANSYTLYTAEITVFGLEDLTVVWKGTQTINDIKIYHSEVQIPSDRYLCEKKNCSHMCSVVYRVPQCECPEEMVLGPDTRSCSALTSSAEPTPRLPTVTESHHRDNDITILYIAVLTCFTILLIVILLQIYMISKQKKMSREYVFHYNKGLGQAELTQSS